VVEEASQWNATSGHLFDDNTPSEGSESAGSSDGNKSDSWMFNFSKQDVILIVDDNRDVKTYIRSM